MKKKIYLKITVLQQEVSLGHGPPRSLVSLKPLDEFVRVGQGQGNLGPRAASADEADGPPREVTVEVSDERQYRHSEELVDDRGLGVRRLAHDDQAERVSHAAGDFGQLHLAGAEAFQLICELIVQ